MSKSVLSRCGDFTLMRDDQANYYIYELKETVLGASGTLKELRDELIRWSVEVDNNNNYMLEVERKFIYALNMCEKLYNKTLSKQQLKNEFNSIGLDMTEKNFEGKYYVKNGDKIIHEFKNLKLGTFCVLNYKTGILAIE